MLEERVRQIKLGHKISYSAIKQTAEHQNVSPNQTQLTFQRLESFERGRITDWEALGYLTGVLKGLVVHPLTTYRLLIKK